MRVLVDTNILLRSVQPNHPLFGEARGAVAKLLRQNDAVFFCSQNIAEFWSVATRPVDRNGLGLTPEEAAEEVQNIESFLTLLPDVPTIYDVWKELVNVHHVRGIKVYDTRLVAVMTAHVVEGLLTFNPADFRRYAKISVLSPAAG